MSNFLYSFEPIKQKSCMLTHDVIINKHIVNIISDPSFFPGPKILNFVNENLLNFFFKGKLIWLYIGLLPKANKILFNFMLTIFFSKFSKLIGF